MATWTKALKGSASLPPEAAFMLDAVLLSFPTRSIVMLQAVGEI